MAMTCQQRKGWWSWVTLRSLRSCATWFVGCGFPSRQSQTLLRSSLEIWARQRVMRLQDDPAVIVPDEERVEDAGLNYEEAAPESSKTTRRKRAMAIA